MSYLTSAQLAKLRTRLQDEQRDIESRLQQNEHFGREDSMRDETGELSPIDNHPGDLATEMYERGKDLALLEKAEFQLERIDAALEAIEEGTYGKCAVCGEAIPFERLSAVPDTLYCIDHSPRDIVSDRRPAEEDFLRPPFGRTSMDDHEDGYNGFDGEDAWQIVESYGNADSPALSENRDVTDYKQLEIEYDENVGYVESIESFLATDITGRHVSIVRNREYERYMQSNEGEHFLEFSDELDDLS